MDYEFIFSLVFSLLVIIIVGGGILLFPITRRLGRLLERRLEVEALPGDELRHLRESMRTLSKQLETLQERQDFTDRLLSSGGGATADRPTRASDPNERGSA